MKMTVLRFDPDSDREARYEAYELPELEKATVLQALLHIYDEQDSTLAFSYNCRYKNCGLCGMTINGRPDLACLTPLTDGTVVEPLRNLPVLRDLVIDRRKLFADLGTYAAYIPEPADSPVGGNVEVVLEPPERSAYMQCTECLVCVAMCPEYRHDGSGSAGPMTFVKLMQLHLDPRDTTDRQAQARQLGIDKCADCKDCSCPNNIPIRRGAIACLLGERNSAAPE